MQHVLIVDDEAGTRQVLKLYLERSGLEVSVAANLSEAISCADRRLPDLALCDWRLADDVSGLEVLRALKQRSEKLPMLVMTGMAGDDLVRDLETLGMSAEHVVIKPFRASELLRRIREILD